MTTPIAATGTATEGLRLSDFHELTKPRLTSLVIATAAVGYLVGSPARIDWLGFVLMVLGMMGVVGGGNALNEYWEREIDARMERTRNRPLPAGRLTAASALAFGALISVGGLALLALGVNLASALVAASGWLSYVLVYTPLKQRTASSTLIGAFPGAVPPLVGWAAARGTVDAAAWSLFAIIFVWQIPHFFAISRHFRDDYARGGFPLLSVQDVDGVITARISAAYALLLVPVGALPTVLGLAGAVYLVGSLVLGVGFFAATAWALAAPGAGHERWVFLGSLVYLTLLMAILVVDRAPVG